MDAPFPKGMLEEIEKFFEEVHPELAVERGYCEQVFSSQLFFPLQRRGEMKKMLEIASTMGDTGRLPRVVCEIGADKGGGLYHWCECLPTVQRVIAVEIRGTPYSKVFQKGFPTIEFAWGACHSRDPNWIAYLWRFLNLQSTNTYNPDQSSTPIDILFIDGDKGTMEQDFDTYLPMMASDGIVFIHDIQDVVPRNAFHAICSRGYRNGMVIDYWDWWTEELKMKHNQPAENPHADWVRTWKGQSCGVGVIYLASLQKGPQR